MNKGQMFILLLIIALACYYLNEEKPSFVGDQKPHQPKKDNWTVIKPKSIQATKPTLPKSQIEPTEFKLPSDTPIAEFPSTREEVYTPATFGLNPPHSELNEPGPQWEQTSSLTEAEKTQRLTQELSDYNWLLNNKTLSDWHHEQKLTDAQFQVLRNLVDQEEMNLLQHFLNLLPANYEWFLISADFKNPSLIKSWTNLNFTYTQVQDWLKIGLQPTDYSLAAWLRDHKKLTPEATLNLADFEQLKAEFAHQAS